MNLVEARKQAFEGWVRSPSRGGEWIRFAAEATHPEVEDLDVEDWEPKRESDPWEGSL